MPAAKQPASPKVGSDGIAFEEALKKLETIVESMETGDLPLEKMLSQYEEGMRLGQVCQSKLAEAELRILQLEKNAEGGLSLKSLTESGLEDE